ncbi:MAG: LCP family protein [Clostridia bacterium]|nr:LCP family protein [Clostridia bacterium]
MAENRFKNDDEFENIFSNSPKNDEFEDIYSSSPEHIEEDDDSVYFPTNTYKPSETPKNEKHEVIYNPSFTNRVRQEINYNDVNEIYSDSYGEENKPKKKRHTVRNTIIALLCVVLIGGSCLGIFAYSTLKDLLSSFNTEEQLSENSHIDSSLLYKDNAQINILLVGADAREGETESRSDTMILVTLDHKNQQIKLTSFLRDSYVEIAGKNRKSKLNSAFFVGGIQGLTDTLEMNFKVDIDYYAMVDFEIFTTIVDEIGGINVEVTEKESRYSKWAKNDGELIPIEAGESVSLNGKQALWYSRMRSLDSDFMRTQRQRKVITAIVEKSKTLSMDELYNLAKTIIPLVKTNLDSKEILNMGTDALVKKLYTYDIFQQQIPANGTWHDENISGVGASLVMDLDENVDILHKFLSEKQELSEETTK